MKRYFSVLALVAAVFFAGNVLAADQAVATDKAQAPKKQSKTFKSKNKKKVAPAATPAPTPAPEKK